MPGNVYPFGETMPPLLQPSTPRAPNCEVAQLRLVLEQKLQTAADAHGVQTLLVRAGGYIDGRDTGNWFESYFCKDLDKGKFMYPGPTDVNCAWVYLPDVASVMVQLSERREELATYEDIGIPGFSVTGAQMKGALQDQLGKPLRTVGMPWSIIKLLGWFQPKMKAVHDLRYLFHVPHAIDGARLTAILPSWRSTTLRQTVESVV